MFRTQVTKRNGQLENVSFDKITERIQSMLMKEPKITNIDPIKIAQAICTRIHHAIHTSELDNLAAEYCISMAYQHPNYSTLASRLTIDNHHKNTPNSILDVTKILIVVFVIIVFFCYIVNVSQ